MSELTEYSESERTVTALERIATALEAMAGCRLRGERHDAMSLPEPVPLRVGFFAAMRAWRRLLPCRELLSTRAESVLYRANYRHLSDITKEALLAERNCGDATARKILEWKKVVMKQISDSE